MSSFILNLLISSLTGVGASLFIWWLTFKYWSPTITFGDKISQSNTSENSSNLKYRFKFENNGKRNIVDLDVIVRLRIKGLRKNWDVVYLPTSTLEYKKIAIVRPVSTSKLRPVLEIKTYECDYFQNSFFPPEIIKKSYNKELTLDDVLNLGSETEFQIMILGTDEFSGARKFFESKVFKKEDVIYGCFNKNGLNIMNTH